MQAPASLRAPTLERIEAAMLLADVSGFTSLAEKLAEHGPIGTEALTQLLNLYFEALIECVSQHGGEVQSFAGDALFALWPVTLAGQLSEATLHAVRCGLAIQQRIASLEVETRLSTVSVALPPQLLPAKLRLRISVGVGEAFLANLGGNAGRWQFLTAGEPFKQIARADRLARPDEVVISELAWRLVSEHCLGQPLEDGFMRILREVPPQSLPFPPAFNTALPGKNELPADAELLLQGYVPRLVLDRLRAQQTHWLAEMRRASVLFVNLGSREFGMVGAFEQMQEVVVSLQSILTTYESSRMRVEADEKGTVLIAAFGLPPLTHEDDAVRAVLAGLALQNRLRELGGAVSVGVTTGRLWTGIVGNPIRRDYTLIGDAVNLASRLMQAAQGGILCDLATWQAAQERVQFEVLPALNIKGKTEPVPVFRPVGMLAASADARRRRGPLLRGGADPELLGRQAERQLLFRQHLQLLQRQSGLVIIEGEPGIGKSRLLAELRERGRSSPILLLSGTADAIARGTPYHAWRPIFAQLYHPAGAGGSVESTRARILARLKLEPPWSELAPLLNPVLPLELPETPLIQQMGPKARGEQTLRFLVQLLAENARMVPLLIVLDDAHWLDSSSWALVEAVAREVQPLLLVLSLRAMNPAPRELRTLIETRSPLMLALKALSFEDTGTLVCQRLGVRRVQRSLLLFIHERSGGQPLFCEEMLEELRERGALRISEGEARLDASVPVPVLPSSLEGLLTSRLDRLSPNQQLVLKVASVIGRSFPFPLLHDIFPVESVKAELLSQLNALEHLEILQSYGSGTQSTWSFRQSTARDTVYQLMLLSQRQELHRAVATWYQQHRPEDRAHEALLAWHWEQAGALSEAFQCLERAAEASMKGYAMREALKFFTDALALEARGQGVVPRLTRLRRARWLRLMGEAHIGLGNIAPGCASLEQALELLGRPRPSTENWLLLQLLGAFWVQLAHLLMPRLFVGQKPGDQTLIEATLTCERLAESAFYTQEKLWGVYNAVGSLNMAEACGPSPEMARGYANMCVAAGVMSLHSLAQHFHLRARTVAREVNNLQATAWVLFLTSVYDVGIGRLSAAREALTRASQLYKRLGDRRHLEMTLAWNAWAASLRGELKVSLDLYQELSSSANTRGDGQSRLWGLTGQVNTLLQMGRIHEASQLIETVDPERLPPANRLERIFVYGYLALCALKLGQPAQALEGAERVRVLLNRMDAMVSTLNALGATAEVYATLLDQLPSLEQEEARRLQKGLADVIVGLRRFSRLFPVGRALLFVWEGVQLMQRGKSVRARRRLLRAVKAAQQREMPFEQGLAWKYLTRLEPEGTPAHLHAELQARGCFERAGVISVSAE